jgi:thiol-disulfide isomerase/thioredoxin
MKISLLLPVSAILLSPALYAAEPAATTPPAATKSIDFSAFKTADDFWKQIEKLQEQPTERPKTREEMMEQVRNWFGTQQTAAEAFLKAFPEDARRWQARMIVLRAGIQLRRFAGQPSAPDADRQKLEEIINAPDAPATVKGEAAFMEVMTRTAEFAPGKPETYAAFYKAADDFLAKYADHPLAAQLPGIELQVLSQDTSPAGEEVLKKFAAGSDARIAGAAKTALEKRQKMAGLKTKPVDLKFTATDGKEIDLANFRGKVVLVDFWASWCGPCIGEMPNVVTTYQKLHSKGFEILGISLDQDKDAMEAALKKHEMTWAQYFDGAGWQNKISTSFGINSIPAAWLIDKKGMLRETGLRGEALGAGVEKLLAE